MYRPTDRRLLIVLVVGLCGLTSRLFSQDRCDPETVLTQATEEFNAGHFSAVESALKPCIDRSFTKEQLVRAYQLLTQTYLILDKPQEAEQSYLSLLEANPEYISNPDRDPIDIVYLSKKFTATPILSWYVRMGANTAVPRVIVRNTVNEGSKQRYSIAPRWLIGGGALWNYNDRITAELGLNFSMNTFTYHETEIFQYDQLTVRENQFTAQMPLSIKYTHIRKGISPYGYAGVSASAMLSGSQDFTFVDRTPTFVFDETLQRDVIVNFADQEDEGVLNTRYKRNFLYRSFHLGGGFRWKYKLDYLFVDVRYSFGMNNVVNDNYIYYRPDESSAKGPFGFGFVDDFFRLDQAVLSVGYIRPLYKPRKLKHVRTKSVLRDVKREDDEKK